MPAAPPLDAALVLAGGRGTRLWPWTGPELPKPLLPLGGSGRTLLRATVERLDGIAPPGELRLLAPRDQAPALVAELGLDAAAAALEPSPRDTAPAIALAMRRMLDARPEAVVAVLPADQRVADEEAFREALRAAAGAARGGALALLGVVPNRPATGFGYIEPERAARAGEAVPVRRFLEKPDAETARRLVAAGCLWNAGVFVWRVAAFWQALLAAAPEVAEPVDAFVRSGRIEDWERSPRTSIDYALLERTHGIAVVPLDAGWDDIGGWEAVPRLAERGEAGPAVARPLEGEPDGSVMLWIGPDPPPPRGLLVGKEPLLVVRGPHGLLVAPRAEADRVKRLL